MAKKKQKDEEKNEEFNEDSFEDINDADDSFGLPDVEMEPLSEVDEPEEETGDSAEEETATEDTAGEVDEDIEGESSQEVEASGEDYSYKEPGEDEKVDETETSDQSAETEVTSSYLPPKKESIMLKLLGLGALVIFVGWGIWYFLLYRPEQASLVAEEKARQEQLDQQRAEEARLQQEADRAKAEEEEAARLAALEAEPKEPELGTITEISERTGRYYVVIGSFIDDDLAKDYGNKLAVEGLNTSLISPFGTVKFYRLALASHESFAEAQGNADELKATYGEALWVLKF